MSYGQLRHEVGVTRKTRVLYGTTEWRLGVVSDKGDGVGMGDEDYFVI